MDIVLLARDEKRFALSVVQLPQSEMVTPAEMIPVFAAIVDKPEVVDPVGEGPPELRQCPWGVLKPLAENGPVKIHRLGVLPRQFEEFFRPLVVFPPMGPKDANGFIRVM